MFTLGTTRMCRGALTCENSDTGQTRDVSDTFEPVNPCETYNLVYIARLVRPLSPVKLSYLVKLADLMKIGKNYETSEASKPSYTSEPTAIIVRVMIILR